MKCALDVCTCEVIDGLDHCGPTCRMGIKEAGTVNACKCGHAGCSATIGESSHGYR